MGTIVGSQFLDQFALETNGSTQYAFCDNPSFKADTQGAFAFWYRPTTVLSSTGVKSLISYGVKDAGNNSQLTFLQRWNVSTTIGIPYRSNPIPDIVGRATHNGTIDRAYGQHVFTAAQWGLLGVQSNGSAWEWFWNGASIGGVPALAGLNTGLWLGGISGSDHRLVIGSQFTANVDMNFSDQRSNEVLYFNRPLTSGEWTALYNGGVPRNPHRIPSLWPDCKLWLRCGDSRDNSTTMFDESGNGNDFTLVASPSYVAV
jgi:hypothetical protein